jgi:hypothetical protein
MSAFQPQTHVKQHQQDPLPAVMPASADGVSQMSWKGSPMEQRGPLLSQQDAHNACQQSESSEHEPQGESAEESWWEELRGLDYPEDASDPKYAGEII